MAKAVKRFYIPGGGSFDFALDDDAVDLAVNTRGAVLGSSGTWPTIIPVMVGALAGAGAVALYLHLRRR